MHQKKSDIQIGKDSSGVSSDFNPTPTINIHNHHNHLSLFLPNSSSSSSSPIHDSKTKNVSHNQEHHIVIQNPITPKSTPHKRPVFSLPITNAFTASLTKSFSSKTKRFCNTRYVIIDLLRHFHRLQTHVRLIFLLSFPFFFFLVLHLSRSFFLDFISAFIFSAALLLSLNLAIPRLPSIRFFLSKSFPIKVSKSPLPVFWSIGSKTKPQHSYNSYNSGCWVQAYNNGDVYEGEFHKGKCSGCGVYYYHMSGRYEGDWVDGKYDGYGVETWARGSRYRGQYRVGLRNGFGVYRFYTGDVYSGEWSNGHNHGCGIHTCEDGSRYVGQFKWGVKHGFGHYHFR